MQQIKFFKGVENDLVTLERDINAWLKSSGAMVQSITGNIAPQTHQTGPGGTQLLGADRAGGKSFHASDIMLCILYEPKS